MIVELGLGALVFGAIENCELVQEGDSEVKEVAEIGGFAERAIGNLCGINFFGGFAQFIIDQKVSIKVFD